MTKSEAFSFLNRLAQGIALIFGTNCETVIHDFSDGSMKNVAIYNNSVSGRSVGSETGIFDASLVDTSQIQNVGTNDIINQIVHLKNGRTVKSSTFFLTGKNYILTQMTEFLNSVTANSGDLFSTMCQKNDITASPLEQIFSQALSQIAVPVSDMNKEDRIALVSLLKEQDYFHLQKSVPYVAEQLHVSKYTIYKYINELDVNN